MVITICLATVKPDKEANHSSNQKAKAYEIKVAKMPLKRMSLVWIEVQEEEENRSSETSCRAAKSSSEMMHTL